ncbi:hypothetical protein LINPERHAP2_LOCUS3386 [Linum perenne]
MILQTNILTTSSFRLIARPRRCIRSHRIITFCFSYTSNNVPVITTAVSTISISSSIGMLITLTTIFLHWRNNVSPGPNYAPIRSLGYGSCVQSARESTAPYPRKP